MHFYILSMRDYFRREQPQSDWASFVLSVMMQVLQAATGRPGQETYGKIRHRTAA
jgi:hypothetical protein